MKIADLGEFGLIRKIKKQSSPGPSSTRNPSTALGPSSMLIGIGDDAAVLSLSASKKLLATTDLLLEGVHFDLSYTDFYSLGWKSAAVNLSDIAAMGGIPRFCFTALGISSPVSVEQIEEFYKGFNTLCRKYNVALAGGDTCRSVKGLVISISALGETEQKNILTRAGALPGDHVFVTGTLGDSAAGMEMVKEGYRVQGAGFRVQDAGFRGKGYKYKMQNSKSAIAGLIKKHLQPVPRIEWGRKLALSGCATAMIDVSDGLSSDLGHICEESGAGVEIYAGQIPISKGILEAAGFLNTVPLQYALTGGEDYELLFTVSPSKLKKFLALKIPSTEIGRMIAGKKMFLSSNGRRTPLKPMGFNHFAGDGPGR